MDDLLKESLNEIKSFINKSVIVILSIMIISTISYVNSAYFDQETPIKFLEAEIHTEYLSLILGCLYFGFFLFIYSKLHQLKLLIEEINKTNENQTEKTYKIIKYYSWVSSPIHESQLSLFTFWGLIILMYLHMLSLAISHLVYRPKSLPASAEVEYLYILVGGIIAVLLLLSLIPLNLLMKDVFSLRKTLGFDIPERINKIFHFTITAFL